MIWATWRQHRATLIAALSVIGLLVIVTVVSGILIRPAGEVQFLGAYTNCYNGSPWACRAETSLTATTLLATVLPVLLGAFVGVSVFSRDIDRGTHVLGLTQSTSRARWFWTKLLVVFTPVVLAMAVLGASLQWAWTNSLSSWLIGGSRLSFTAFQSSALMLACATALALILGAAVALVLRRSLASMAITVVVAAAITILVGTFARPHYATPNVDVQSVNAGTSYSSGPDEPRWTVSEEYVDRAGNRAELDYEGCGDAYPDEQWTALRGETAADFESRRHGLYTAAQQEYSDCLSKDGTIHLEVKYHPESQFWRFQLTEAAILLLLAGALLIPARWGLRRLRP